MTSASVIVAPQVDIVTQSIRLSPHFPALTWHLVLEETKSGQMATVP